MTNETTLPARADTLGHIVILTAESGGGDLNEPYKLNTRRNVFFHFLRLFVLNNLRKPLSDVSS